MQVQLEFGLTGGKPGPLRVPRSDASAKVVIILLSGVIIPSTDGPTDWYVFPLFGPEVYVTEAAPTGVMVIFPSPVTV